MSTILVAKPGMLTTIQDLGRWGYQDSGVPVAGPMDSYSHRLANRLVGNPDGAATCEVTVIGPDLVFEDEVIFAIAGGEFPIKLDGALIPTHIACCAGPGSRLTIGMRTRGARAYLAVAGGIDVPLLLGSRATSLVSHMGPFGGRPLRAGDRLSVGACRGEPRGGEPLPLPERGTRLRFIWGPQADEFTDDARVVFTSSQFEVTPQSNRMGYRLSGPRLTHRRTADILSEATPFGSMQVPASGHPILLMADRQTTGGYTKIATIITADLPFAGQLAPGDWVRFTPCSAADARRALADREECLGGFDP
jgi:antagonist of KipI